MKQRENKDNVFFFLTSSCFKTSEENNWKNRAKEINYSSFPWVLVNLTQVWQ